MIVLGVLLVVVGYFLPLHLLYTLGLVLVVIGVVLEILAALGHQVGPRRHYF